MTEAPAPEIGGMKGVPVRSEDQLKVAALITESNSKVEAIRRFPSRERPSQKSIRLDRKTSKLLVALKAVL